jgi:hypothetical protein
METIQFQTFAHFDSMPEIFQKKAWKYSRKQRRPKYETNYFTVLYYFIILLFSQLNTFFKNIYRLIIVGKE